MYTYIFICCFTRTHLLRCFHTCRCSFHVFTCQLTSRAEFIFFLHSSYVLNPSYCDRTQYPYSFVSKRERRKDWRKGRQNSISHVALLWEIRWKWERRWPESSHLWIFNRTKNNSFYCESLAGNWIHKSLGWVNEPFWGLWGQLMSICWSYERVLFTSNPSDWKSSNDWKTLLKCLNLTINSPRIFLPVKIKVSVSFCLFNLFRREISKIN